MTAPRPLLPDAMVAEAPSRRRFTGGPSGAVIAVLVVGAALSVAAPKFLTADNFEVLAYSVANLAVVAFAQMAVLAAGGMDLSVGAVGGLTAVLVGGMMEAWHVPTPLAILAGLALGAAAGALNGLLVVRTGLSAFIVTLATASVFTGLNLGITSGQPFYYLPEDFKAIGALTIAGVPVLLLVMLAVGAVLWFVFSRVGLGRQILSVGANPRAAELAGVPVERSRIVVHALASFLAAFAGIILTARLGVAQPSIGNDWLLQSFAAPIIGGTLLSGGFLSIPGVIAGAFLLTIVANGLIQLNIDPYWTQLFSGLIILAAGGIDRLRSLNVQRLERAERFALANMPAPRPGER
ncbi:MAG TPA: ABC transporter permease [Bauldia sp.]|nr:ABC transporter permease [Bauldia sp.]